MDRFNSMTELISSIPKEDYKIEYRLTKSNVLVVSPHGGRIEFGTSQLAKAVAGNDFSGFDFQGLLDRENFKNLHVTSSRFDLPMLQKLNDESDITLTIHGFKSTGGTKYTIIGGLDEEGKRIFSEALREAGFSAILATEKYTGLNADNIANKNRRGMGIQLELSTEQRIAFFKDTQIKLSERTQPSYELYSYASALRQALFKLQDVLKVK